ncbi:hypothetical protein [Solimonas sp. SE-A11]|uniref:hypothetical protein n=1 Tax=Solimonas sp. SE-A11 TaxID=3054954 RepID=UPI00259CD045|nr:hypothetical protein [Solimonas sp. SE-A11]MDM4770795.1 hypothetical protein [Solimonas sp. SE-A11]
MVSRFIPDGCGRLALAFLLAGLAACHNSSSVAPGGQTGNPEPIPEEKPSIDSQLGLDLLPGTCDPLDPNYCTFPWPNDFFTVADASMDTGRRLNLQLAAMPRNVLLKPITPTDWNKNDGFSPGNAILTRIPGVDLAKTGAVPITDIEASLRADQPIVVIDADTLERHLIWSEMDANLTKSGVCDLPDPLTVVTGLLELDQLTSLLRTVESICDTIPLPENPLADPGPALIVRPAKNFEEGHRYIVAMRNMKNAAGEIIEPSPAFRIYRDNHKSGRAAINERRPHMEDLFAKLGKAGIKRSELYLAWDFTVASERNLSERALKIRDTAFADLGNAAPPFTVDEVTDFNVEQNATIARQVKGTVTVPKFLTGSGAPGSRFNYSGSSDGLPTQNGTMSATYTCRIPRVAFGNAANAAEATTVNTVRPSLYGHGLLGSQGEVGGGHIGDTAQNQRLMFCAADWIGMSEGDVFNVLTLLLDMSNFTTLTDRGQQGFLNWMFIGRALINEQGFCSNAAFRVGDRCVIDRGELFYDGNSQGGIMGGSLVALSPDIRAGVLGVPGMNYSTLLQRSVDFDTYAAFFYTAYPASLDQAFTLALIQMLWDRSEMNGYAQHLRADEPYPNTPPKRVLLHPAFGDHQVSMTTAEVAARTIGAKVHCPAVVGGSRTQRGPAVFPGVHPLVEMEPDGLGIHRRHHDDEPYYGIPCMSYPHNGSALVVWDSGPLLKMDGTSNPDGVATPPIDNRPPRPELGYGADPHSFPRKDPHAQDQKGEFLKSNGRVINVCGNEPCAVRGFDPSP